MQGLEYSGSPADDLVQNFKVMLFRSTRILRLETSNVIYAERAPQQGIDTLKYAHHDKLAGF